ncbi:MAM and LDL-receptor class A domain-containing protein 1-like isoform X2 [Phymastichus coffea]|uniref:MAM and LDL-receptor class A domain-containing protein 1-like isoform X2 n=1 Tax=Phymastichus coffea TaxID=108790 RepID=UPI00273CDA46|nr:MAM and LDL-receptor class A domain-containing protein 1-like isoform X2 [Phymastichus coffea]
MRAPGCLLLIGLAGHLLHARPALRIGPQHRWLGASAEGPDEPAEGRAGARRPAQPEALPSPDAVDSAQQQRLRLPPVVLTASADEVFCDFGPLPAQSLCEWQDGCGALRWTAGTGLAANWLGGPPTDATTGSAEGGYAFLECSRPAAAAAAQGAEAGVGPGGLLHSPQLGSTGALGSCLSFKYAIDGLSPAALRVLLHAGFDEFSSTAGRLNDSVVRPISASCDGPPAARSLRDEQTLWHAHYLAPGSWQQAQLLYTYPEPHTLIIEGVPVEAADPSSAYRGYIAVDDVDLQPGSSCVGFCNFAAGLCDWTNDPDDDFDWSIARGSSRPTTGPVADRDAAAAARRAGGYAFADSGHPRRPGDAARLLSVGMPASAPDAPACLRFSFHMFGAGVGELRLSLRQARNLEARPRELWRLRGNAGNSWFDARVTVSSLDDFQLVFEASVGNTGMGDIAIDDLAFSPGACPTSPQAAAPPRAPRDCSFEIDDCEWLNSREAGAPAPGGASGPAAPARATWERVSQQSLGPRGQRRPYSLPAARPRQEFAMALQARGQAAAASGSAYLLGSLVRPADDEPLCLGFWYLMSESFIDAAGPSLGVLRVLVQPVGEGVDAARPIWQLYNDQGPGWNYGQAAIAERRDFHVLFEGTWGPNRASGDLAIDDIAFYAGNCSVKPRSAAVRAEDCSFEKGLCGWENVTSGAVSDPRVQWQRAYPNHRPAQLLDKTFGSSGDFVFFDVFSPSQKRHVRLRSPLLNVSPDEEATCFSFWFAAFGVEEATSLSVLKLSSSPDNASPEASAEDDDSERQVLWSLTAKGFNNPRPAWTWAQMTVESRSPYHLVLEGTASNGGFAIDDVRFQAQACPTRPATASPSMSSQEL